MQRRAACCRQSAGFFNGLQSVALNNWTLVVGKPQENSGVGAAHVFQRAVASGRWRRHWCRTEQARALASVQRSVRMSTTLRSVRRARCLRPVRGAVSCISTPASARTGPSARRSRSRSAVTAASARRWRYEIVVSSSVLTTAIPSSRDPQDFCSSAACESRLGSREDVGWRRHGHGDLGEHGDGRRHRPEIRHLPNRGESASAARAGRRAVKDASVTTGPAQWRRLYPPRLDGRQLADAEADFFERQDSDADDRDGDCSDRDRAQRFG